MWRPQVDAHLLHTTLRGSQLITIPDVGHMPNLENAPAFNAALGNFLASIPTGRKESVVQSLGESDFALTGLKRFLGPISHGAAMGSPILPLWGGPSRLRADRTARK